MTGAAAVIMRREKDLVELFRGARALSPDTAQSLRAVGASDGVPFRRLRQRAVLREAPGGRFYLDEPSWAAFTYIRRRLMLVLLLIVLGLIGTGAITLFTR